ncbi:MAG TPA: hypothetical protein VHN14_14505 [Kofleriaceae bacterium]|jgi:hypothetical protein|nr:hypothetical protein [Kofleriaceae bacterium]
MPSIDSIPQARVVRNAGRLIAPPRAPRSDDAGSLREYLRIALGYAIGLWPLTCVVLLAFGLLVMASHLTDP